MASAPRSSSLFALALAALLAVIAVATASQAENTPPEVEVTTPTEGTLLGLQVVVSGTATDGEGFNMSSHVEARWNDWEWFTLPSTPAQAGKALQFGEVINLVWHTPGRHTLFVRAFDGELYSEESQVNVTVRDLPDLVVMPTDIHLDPADGVAGEEVDIIVIVQNQGGEAVGGVEVTIEVGGKVTGVVAIGSMEAHGNARATLRTTLEEGNMTVRASAYAVGTVEEKSLQNNEAEATLIVEGGGEGPDIGDIGFVVAAVVLGVVLVLAVTLAVLLVVGPQKD